jgi:flagellar biosynthetic protein FlhB
VAEQSESASKEFEPSQKKLEDLRKKGDIPKSADLNAAAGLFGFIAICLIAGSENLLQTARELAHFFVWPESVNRFTDGPFSQPRPSLPVASLVGHFLPWFLVPAAVVFAAILVQKSLVFAPSKLQPKLSRISPLSNAKNKFGRSGIFEFLKSFLKLGIVSLALVVFLAGRFEDIAAVSALSPQQGIMLMTQLVVEFLWVVFVFYLVVGALDLLWQRAEHLRKNRMSRQEMTDEHKQSEGDPQVKQQRRQRAQDIATNRMLADVQSADVIVVNPTHYSVALSWDRERGTAPKCVAKGVDEMARTIRRIATESGVPIFSDAPAARAMYAIVDIGAEIPAEHYRSAAAAIRFADRLAASARNKWNTQ